MNRSSLVKGYKVHSGLPRIVDEEVATGYWAPPVDLSESSSEVIVRVELPGVEAANVEVAICEGLLKIYGHKECDTDSEKPVCYLRIERNYGRFYRALRLHTTVDSARATAQLTNGVLVIRVPKLEERRCREVKIPVVG